MFTLVLLRFQCIELVHDIGWPAYMDPVEYAAAYLDIHTEWAACPYMQLHIWTFIQKSLYVHICSCIFRHSLRLSVYAAAYLDIRSDWLVRPNMQLHI